MRQKSRGAANLRSAPGGSNPSYDTAWIAIIKVLTLNETSNYNGGENVNWAGQNQIHKNINVQCILISTARAYYRILASSNHLCITFFIVEVSKLQFIINNLKHLKYLSISGTLF